MTPRTAARALSATFLVTGVTHLVAPAFYEPLVPPALPGRQRWWVYASGAAELGCAAGLAAEATRRRAAEASAVLLVAVFPGNAWMAWQWRHRAAPLRLAAVLRLPVQVPLVAWARYCGRAAQV